VFWTPNTPVLMQVLPVALDVAVMLASTVMLAAAMSMLLMLAPISSIGMG
jgi:hypothetical protein